MLSLFRGDKLFFLKFLTYCFVKIFNLYFSGMGPMPWTVNSEIYPLWARSTGNACSSGINWIFNVLVSLTFLHTAEYLTYYGKRIFFLQLYFYFSYSVLRYAIINDRKARMLYFCCFISLCGFLVPSPWRCSWEKVRGILLPKQHYFMSLSAITHPPSQPKHLPSWKSSQHGF